MNIGLLGLIKNKKQKKLKKEMKETKKIKKSKVTKEKVKTKTILIRGRHCCRIRVMLKRTSFVCTTWMSEKDSLYQNIEIS